MKGCSLSYYEMSGIRRGVKVTVEMLACPAEFIEVRMR